MLARNAHLGPTIELSELPAVRVARLVLVNEIKLFKVYFVIVMYMCTVNAIVQRHVF